MNESPRPPRSLAIDTLRGLDMFFLTGGLALVTALVRVFHGGSLPDWYARHAVHANWEGFHAWDLVMPLFIFIVGASMPYAFAKFAGTPKSLAYGRMARRVALLFLLGMAVQGNLLSFEPERMKLFCNTLQAIAGGYLIAGICLLHTGVRGQLATAFGLLAAYWALLRFVPYDGQPGGLFLPGNNLALYIDRLLEGSWHDGTNYTWILTNLAFGALTLLGAMGGHVLRSSSSNMRKLAVLCAAGCGCLLAGWALSFDTPMIKRLFTSSMTLWSAGWCYLLLAFCLLVFDIFRLQRLAFPLAVIGSNALFVYLWTETPGCSPEHSLSRALFGGLAKQSGEWGEVVFYAGNYALIWGVLWLLYRKKVFLKV